MYKRLPVPQSKQPRSSFLPVGHRPLPQPSTKPAEPPVLPPILHDMLPKFQAKLTVGQPNDQYEQEADQVADQVMRMPEPKIQRVCPECEEELQRQEEEDEEERLQTKPLAEQITPLVQRHQTIQRQDRVLMRPSLRELMVEYQLRIDKLHQWLEDNRITVSLISMNGIIQLIRRNVPEAESLSDSEISAFVRSWAQANSVPMSRVSSSDEPSPPSSTPIDIPEWLSFYSDGSIGFHVTLNPVGEVPLPARIMSYFRERGLPVSSDLLSELLHNREAGIASLQVLLREILPAEFANEIPSIATYIADKLMDSSLEAYVQRERPTPSEQWEERDERIRQIFAGSESREISPLQEFIEDLSVGVSLTVHF